MNSPPLHSSTWGQDKPQKAPLCKSWTRLLHRRAELRLNLRLANDDCACHNNVRKDYTTRLVCINWDSRKNMEIGTRNEAWRELRKEDLHLPQRLETGPLHPTFQSLLPLPLVGSVFPRHPSLSSISCFSPQFSCYG